MLALVLVTTAAAHVLAVVVAAAIVVFLVSRATMNPHQRMMRARRRHAEQTAHAMRRMTRIKTRTIRRMDEAERRWHP
jgi:mannitol-specific phosphotransferase system IIBC component